MTPKRGNADYSQVEAQRSRDVALRAALSMAAITQVKSSPKKKPKASKKASKS